MKPPKKLELIDKDFNGEYIMDCAIARALKRKRIKEFGVGGWGKIYYKDSHIGCYKCEDGTEFNEDTFKAKRTGTLIFHPSTYLLRRRS